MAESPNHWFAVHASLVWELKVGTRGRYIDKGRGQEIKFGREEEGRRSEGGDSKSVKALIRSVHRPSLILLLVY